VYDARTRAYLSRCLADAFLAGVWNERALVDRAGRALDRRPRWVRSVAREVLAGYHGPPSTPMRTLQHWMGHADSKTTQIYAHYQPSDQEADAVDRAFS
jgi:integrase